ncbi:hypothetical protein EJB05_34469 [Eragrostis curvula]|uniref:DUF6598 domain-containing protein n=1 Tax=Eragrostis curvula TaxID=38414 RepID=A0A5J9U541_9POAL|nr:hypothetical protein EJB05_34469 [Eragrostis curvula]
MSEAESKAKAPTWVEVHEMEARAMGERVSLICKKIGDLCSAIKDEKFMSGLSEAEREAKKAAAEEERVALVAEFHRLAPLVDREPDYSGMSEAERVVEAERMRRQALEEARRLELEGDPYFWMQERVAAVVDFDPKQGGSYYNRFHLGDCPEFDIDEESPLGPMRFTDTVYKTNRFSVCQAVNILSVKIACSDVGFPIQVYGTVIARDSIDEKCLYLFRRDRDHCQLINSKEKLIIGVKSSAGKCVRISFTPRGGGGCQVLISIGATEMRVKVAWSIMEP